MAIPVPDPVLGQQVQGQYGAASEFPAPQGLDDVFCIPAGPAHQILLGAAQGRADGHFILFGHVDELRHHAHDPLPQLHVPLGKVHDEPHAVLVSFPLAGHLLQHMEPGGHGAALLLLLPKGFGQGLLLRKKPTLILPCLTKPLPTLLPTGKEPLLFLLGLFLLLPKLRLPLFVLRHVVVDGLAPLRQRLLQGRQPRQAALLIGQAVQLLHNPILLFLKRSFRLIARFLQIGKSCVHLLDLLLQGDPIRIGQALHAVQGELALVGLLGLGLRFRQKPLPILFQGLLTGLVQLILPLQSLHVGQQLQQALLPLVQLFIQRPDAILQLMTGLLEHTVLGFHTGELFHQFRQDGLLFGDLLSVFLRLVKEQIHLQPAQLLPGSLILDGLLPLLPQGSDPALQFVKDVADPLHILLGALQLSLSFGAAHTIAHDAGRLLQRGATIGGLVGQNLVHLSLGDDGIPVPADARVPEQLQHVLQTAGLAVDGIFALPVSVHPAGDAHLLILDGQGMVGIVKGQRHLSHAQRTALLGAVKDHVLHLGAPKSPGALLAQDPADRVGDVALAAAVGADDGRDAAAELQFRFLCKGFEPLHFQFRQSHVCVYLSMAI